jgi:hypothetical protein
MMKFYVRRAGASRNDNLVQVWATEEEIRYQLAFGVLSYAEDSKGNPIY